MPADSAGALRARVPEGASEAPILALDAATYVGSVAVLRGRSLLAERSVAMRGEREERLLPAVSEALEEAGVEAAALQRIVCGAGPGSFTSLRIAASIAKGIAQAVGAPLFAVSSLTLVVAGARPALAAGRYLATLDAMRGERYAALIEVARDGAIRELAPPRLVERGALEALAEREEAMLVGPEWTVAGRADPLLPRAAGVAALGATSDGIRAVELASWEPSYGRLAEAQVKWEAAHGRALSSAGP